MDPEIKAMSDIAAALKPLQPEEVRRVLKWASEKYQVKLMGGAPTPTGAAGAGAGVPTGSTEFSDFPALFDAASPTTGLERILTCAYWFQAVRGMPDFDSQSLNNELKNMGHPSLNITRDLESLSNRSPKLVIQTRKDGKTKQARKRFRITQEGMREVQRMLERRESTPSD